MLNKKIKFSIPLKITFFYFFISGLYSVLSDKFLESNFSNETYTELQPYKKLFFISLTAFLLFIIIKKSSDKINRSKEKYQLLADHTKDLICLHKPNAEFIYLSPSVETLIGYDKDELIGRNLYEFVHPSDIKRIKKESHETLLKGKTVDILIYRIKKKTGEYIWFESLTQPIMANNKMISVVSSSRDVTERIKANESIKNYQISLQNLTSEILLVEEKQKKKIARNIHDHLSQSLVISKMKLTDLKKHNDLSGCTNEIDFIMNQINQAIENSRKITYDLSPPVLYELGIIETMHWLSDKIEEEHNIKVKFTTNSEQIKLEDNKLIFIFRSIQEITTNTIKHAKASLITINFDSTKTGLKISIQDNGIGFDMESLQRNEILNSGFGLFTVKERIQNLKGDIKIISKANNKGTTTNIVVPF